MSKLVFLIFFLPIVGFSQTKPTQSSTIQFKGNGNTVTVTQGKIVNVYNLNNNTDYNNFLKRLSSLAPKLNALATKIIKNDNNNAEILLKELDRMKYPFKLKKVDIGIDFPIEDSATIHYYNRLYPQGDFWGEIFGKHDSAGEGSQHLFDSDDKEPKEPFPNEEGIEAPLNKNLASLLIFIQLTKLDSLNRNPDIYFNVTSRLHAENLKKTNSLKPLTQLLFRSNKHFFLKVFDLSPDIIYSKGSIISVKDFDKLYCKIWTNTESSFAKPRIEWLKIYSEDGAFIIIDNFKKTFYKGNWISAVTLPNYNVWHKYADEDN